MNLKDNFDIPMMSHDPTVFPEKPDVYISVKELYNYIAKSKSFRKILVKQLVEDGVLPEQGD